MFKEAVMKITQSAFGMFVLVGIFAGCFFEIQKKAKASVKVSAGVKRTNEKAPGVVSGCFA